MSEKQRNNVGEERTTNRKKKNKTYSKVVKKITNKIHSKIIKDNVIRAQLKWLKKKIQNL